MTLREWGVVLLALPYLLWFWVFIAGGYYSLLWIGVSVVIIIPTIMAYGRWPRAVRIVGLFVVAAMTLWTVYAYLKCFSVL